jgi:hypothetical protein
MKWCGFLMMAYIKQELVLNGDGFQMIRRLSFIDIKLFKINNLFVLLQN